MADGTHTMGCNDIRLTGSGRLHICEDPFLCLCIHCGQRIIQYQHVGIKDQRPGDGNPLILAAEQCLASFPDHIVIPFGELFYVIMYMTEPCRPADGSVIQSGIAERDVAPDGCCKQEMVLRHIAEPAPQIFHIIVPDGMSAVHDIIRIHCIELTEKEPDEGAFAGTGTSYDAERHTFFNSEIDIPQSRRFVIREVEGTDIECYITIWSIFYPVIRTDIIPCHH